MQRFIPTCAVVDTRAIQAIAKEYSLPVLLAKMLYLRGITDKEDIRAFLSPALSQLHDPFLLPDMRAAKERIARAVDTGERICIYGDYDADGICATAILLGFLEARNADVFCYLPSRLHEGYGMHEEAVSVIAEKGAGLIVTVDNGVTALNEIALCTARGIDVVVTDHHQCLKELPACTAVVNAHRADSTYPFEHLCGAGVALKLVQALGGDIEHSLALAALATVADIVPLTGENRAIVAEGLKRVPNQLGLTALLSVSGTSVDALDAEALAFRVAPRINAAGRMGDAYRGLSLLTAKSLEEAHALALTLNDENAARQREEQRIMREVEAMLEGRDTAGMHAITLYGENWSPGVIGIVASKLTERYYRPALLFHMENGILTGSCRSIPGVDIFRALEACGEGLIRFGGHAQAAGLTLKLEAYEKFCMALTAYLKSNVPPGTYVRTRRYDAEASFGDITIPAVEALARMEPYGEGNPRPVFLTKGVGFTDVRQMGKTGACLRAIAMKDGVRLSAISFTLGGREQELSGRADILYTMDVNNWMGKKRLQLRLFAVRNDPFFANEGELEAKRGNFYDAFFHNVLYNDKNVAGGHACEEPDAQIRAALSEDIHGVLLICFSPRGAMHLRQMLLEYGFYERVRVAYNTLPGGSGHTLLLAPRLPQLRLDAYKRVFVYDAGDIRGLIGAIHGAAHGAAHGAGERGIFFANEESGLLTPLRLSRAQMGGLFSEFKAALRNGPQKRGALAAGPAYEQKMFALLVFIELGLFGWNKEGDTVTDTVTDTATDTVGITAADTGAAGNTQQKRNLMDSRLYAAANPQASDKMETPITAERRCTGNGHL